MRRNSKQRVKARREMAVKVLEKSIRNKQGKDELKKDLARAEQELSTVKQRIAAGSPVRRSINRKPAVKTDDILSGV